ncbi:hypothetical protein EDB83DRAFT_381557 [Lactarius deliciosus]|nr:hypothetical protein EDB83DRAFT_381557 [Lactarius deliciosus]
MSCRCILIRPSRRHVFTDNGFDPGSSEMGSAFFSIKDVKGCVSKKGESTILCVKEDIGYSLVYLIECDSNLNYGRRGILQSDGRVGCSILGRSVLYPAPQVIIHFGDRRPHEPIENPSSSAQIADGVVKRKICSSFRCSNVTIVIPIKRAIRLRQLLPRISRQMVRAVSDMVRSLRRSDGVIGFEWMEEDARKRLLAWVNLDFSFIVNVPFVYVHGGKSHFGKIVVNSRKVR